MFIRYNNLAKYFEYDASGGLGAGPWVKLQIDYSQIINIPAGSIVPHATTHNTGGTDPITALSGAVITTGTVADSRLSSNVALKNIDNSFVPQTLGSGSRILGANALLYLQATASPVNSRFWRLTQYGDTTGYLYIEPTDDAGNVQSRVIFKRNGAIEAAGNILSGGYVYPGRADSPGLAQGSWYLASHGSFGLYCSAGFYVAGSIWSTGHYYGSGVIFERSRGVALGEWTPWTPAVVTDSSPQPAPTNLSGRYTLVGKTCHFQMYIQWGGAGEFGVGNWFFAFPVPPSSAMVYYTSIGTAMGLLSGVFKTGIAVTSGANANYFHIVGDGSGYLWAATKPAQWVAGDLLRVSGTYEIA